MTSIKLTELPSATTKNDIDLIYVVQDSTSKKMSIQTLTAGFLTSVPGETFLDKGDQGSTITVDFQAASVQKLRLTQDATLSITNPPTDSVPHFIKLIIEQDGLKSDTPYSWHITFPNNVVFTGSYRAEGNNFVPTFPFGGGTVPTSVPGPVLSNGQDVLTLYTNDDGANYFAWFESNESGVEILNSSFYNGIINQSNIDNCLLANSYIGTHINQGNVSSISGTTNNILLENTAFLMNLTGNLTFTGDFTGIDSVPNSYTQVKLFFMQDVTGGRTVTFSMNDTITWIGGTAPTINPAASSISLVTIARFIDNSNNATYYGWADTGVVTGGGGGGGGSNTASIIVSIVDEFVPVEPGTNKITLKMPYAMTLSGVRASVTTAQGSGSLLTVDVNQNGTSILSTKLTIDNTEKSSFTATTAAVISNTALLNDAEITIDVDQIGDGSATGLKVYLIGSA